MKCGKRQMPCMDPVPAGDVVFVTDNVDVYFSQENSRCISFDFRSDHQWENVSANSPSQTHLQVKSKTEPL